MYCFSSVAVAVVVTNSDPEYECRQGWEILTDSDLCSAVLIKTLSWCWTGECVVYFTDIGPFYEKVILLSDTDTQSSSKHGRHSFYCKRRQEHTVSHGAKPYSPVFLGVTVFLRDTFKCQSFFFPFEIATVNECVESVLYTISLGCQFCPLTDLRYVHFWLVGSSVHTMCSCPFC